MPVETIATHCSNETGRTEVTGQIQFKDESLSEDILFFIIQTNSSDFQEAMNEGVKQSRQLMSYSVVKDLFVSKSITLIGKLDNGKDMYEVAFDIDWPAEYSEIIFGEIKVISASYSADGAVEKAKGNIYDNLRMSIDVDKASLPIIKEIESRDKKRKQKKDEENEEIDQNFYICAVVGIVSFIYYTGQTMWDYYNGNNLHIIGNSFLQAMLSALLFGAMYGLALAFTTRFLLWLEKHL